MRPQVEAVCQGKGVSAAVLARMLLVEVVRREYAGIQRRAAAESRFRIQQERERNAAERQFQRSQRRKGVAVTDRQMDHLDAELTHEGPTPTPPPAEDGTVEF